jgi:tetratricopeptide (TPR) repeat protein
VETAQDFLQTHPNHIELRDDLAWALLKLGDLTASEAPAAYRESLQQFEVALQVDPKNVELQRAVVVAARRLGLTQFAAGDRLAALSSFSRALQMAEGIPAVADSRRVVAECNFEVGEVLARNGAEEAAAAKLRKALETYRELAPEAPRAALKSETVASFETAIAALAMQAPAELRSAIDAELQRWKK